jgi:alpha-ketoglutarate-dependent 2,4-dichlorophenoxyacetate dioxygenase
MAALSFEPLHEEFGARVSGIDFGAPLSGEAVEALHAAIDEYSFLCFPDQAFDDERHLALTRALGEPEANHLKLGQSGIVDYFATIGNVEDDGTALGNDHIKIVRLTGNNMWHSDSSFRQVPSYVSIMGVYEVPSEDGETLFVSARAAYGRLSDEEKRRIDPLHAIHDYVFSRSKVGPDAVTPSHAASLPPVEQKLVRTNPRNGRKNYYVGSHAKSIVGWSETDSRALLDDLQARATADEHVWTHAWTPGEVVIWDNRCLLHRGNGYDADKYRRLMRQTRVSGVSNTLDE